MGFNASIAILKKGIKSSAMSSNVGKKTKHHRGRTTADVLHLQTEHKKQSCLSPRSAGESCNP